LRSNKQIIYGGEEDLLAHYIGGYDENKAKHTFWNSKYGKSIEDVDGILIEPGQWEDTKNHPSYISKKEADQISYLWDNLINQFTRHIIAGTSNTYGHSIKEHEGGVRYMALEPRLYRRMLSKALLSAIKSYPISADNCVPKITTLSSSNQTGLIYLFIQFPFHKKIFSSYEEYIETRRNYLYMVCMAAKSTLPSLLNIPITKVLGIATEPPKHVVNTVSSEDMVLMFCEEWSVQQQAEGDLFRDQLDIFSPIRMKKNQFQEKDFPYP